MSARPSYPTRTSLRRERMQKHMIKFYPDEIKFSIPVAHPNGQAIYVRRISDFEKKMRRKHGARYWTITVWTESMVLGSEMQPYTAKVDLRGS